MRVWHILRGRSRTSCLSFYLSLCLVFTVTAHLDARADTVTQLREQLHRPVPGGVAVVAVIPRADTTEPPAVYLGDHRVLTISDNQSWWAVVGVPLSTTPGTIELSVHTPGMRKTVPIAIKYHEYASQHITLKDQAMVSPPPKTLERIKTELAEQLAAYGTYTDTAPSNLIFDPPVPGRLSSPFGLQRFFNGKPRNPHSGLDFAAPKGTPVKSPANGRVLLIGDYYFNGLTIFIDHGHGVISMFCHLSQINLLPGDVVKRGDVVGTVGSTGRSTGPHLHWNVSLNNARVDPALFLRRSD